jgi:hypothetical protein
MSCEDRLIDPAISGQTPPDSLPRARRDLARDAVVSESRGHVSAAGPSTNPHELPPKLMDAWSRWAASRLSR